MGQFGLKTKKGGVVVKCFVVYQQNRQGGETLNIWVINSYVAHTV